MLSLSPTDALDRVRGDLDRLRTRAHNGLRHLGGVPMGPVGHTPRRTVWSRDNVTLHHYQGRGSRSPVLVVHSLVTQSYVFDLRPGSSLVEDFLAAGHDVYLLDWGIPGPVEAGNTLETYCLEYLPLAVQVVHERTGAPRVDLLGYCLGAVLSLLTLAARPDLPVGSLVALATPVDFTHLGPLATLLQQHQLEPADLLDETGNVPASLILSGFRMSQPTGDIVTYANLWQSLAHDESAAAHQAFVGWSSAHIPFPGAAFEQMVELMVRGDRLRSGSFPLGGRDVSLGAIPARVLSVVGERDNLVPPAATAPLAEALGRPVDNVRLPAGHAGLFVGRQAKKHGIPAMLAWLAEPDPARST
ncbi:alpha/beta fold hydrolase [Sporichthya polymorpha]|uniref:alpha/beta fold hydrolase n=1 Tax=Sporichthya polymorpha TaxID=35751 RepID=UPI0003A18E73|nr:alpha/beta fold hydrolase [Sporichthya polymorpha]